MPKVGQYKGYIVPIKLKKGVYDTPEDACENVSNDCDNIKTCYDCLLMNDKMFEKWNRK